MEQPAELEQAELIDMLCQRYSCLPSALLAEDVSLLYRLAVLAAGKAREGHQPPMGDADFEVDL